MIHCWLVFHARTVMCGAQVSDTEATISIELVTCRACLALASVAYVGEQSTATLLRLHHLQQAEVDYLRAEVERLKAALVERGVDARPLAFDPSLFPVGIEQWLKEGDGTHATWMARHILKAIIERLEGRS